jgi:glutathione gamma-glutamylcysteinyltransferase
LCSLAREEPEEKHCRTCTCDNSQATSVAFQETSAPLFPCGHDNDTEEEMPPPLPEPKYSVHKRVLPENLIAMSSPQGRSMLLHALQNRAAEPYWSLMEHFTNQSDPAYCGITTLQIVLNSLAVDPNVRWRGGWRYYGDEDTILERCCISHERIQRAGISLPQFARLAKCQGLDVTTKQPTTASWNEFRRDVKDMLSAEGAMLVVSFSRSSLGQTGEGHFSPIAAFYEDYVLVLDVARFKYAPYWVSLSQLYEAMKPLDEATAQPRGWFILKATTQNKGNGEARRPAHLVPSTHEMDTCPVGKIKVHYCRAQPPNST